LGLVLVDEASMIDSTLLQIVLQCANTFGTRLVFVGDPAQLPPVGETISPVFSLRRAFTAHLGEVVRHQGPVLQLASRLRDGRLPCKPPPCMPVLETGKGIVGFLDKTTWLKQAKAALKKAADQDEPDSARILCYTNRSLEYLVPHVRRAIHGEMAEQLPVLPGEVLITRMAVMAPASLNGSDQEEEPDMVLGSNTELIVNDVVPETCNLAELRLLQERDYDLPVINTLIATVNAGEQELELRLLPPLGSRSRNLLDKTLQKLRCEAKEAGKNDSRFFWRRYFLIRDSFASLGPAAVLTVHRSQGSTFEKVFVASDVFWPKDISLRKRLVYVAVSRASQGVWLVGSKEDEFVQKTWQENLSSSLI